MGELFMLQSRSKFEFVNIKIVLAKMDVNTFYGKNRSIRVLIPNGDVSEDENLSGDEDFRRKPEFPDIPAEDSDYSINENKDIAAALTGY
ncbi:hypothetical protein FQR65_LT01645 [Abscondita terminalis]|nr:hypothetical protein FQR65_LT01645 [Abscondita terminalis]